MEIAIKSLPDKYFKEFGESQRPMAASIEALTFCEKLIEASNTSSIRSHMFFFIKPFQKIMILRTFKE